MNTKKNLIISILLIIAGAALLAFAIPGKINVFWSGFGGSLIGVAIMQLINQHRYKSNPEFRKKQDIEQKDERNQFLRAKASEYAVSLFVIFAGLACIILGILDKYEVVYILGYAVGALMFLYFISFIIAKKKF